MFQLYSTVNTQKTSMATADYWWDEQMTYNRTDQSTSYPKATEKKQSLTLHTNIFETHD